MKNPCILKLQVKMKTKISLNQLIFRQAKETDRDSILEIYDDGSEFLKQMNIDQWQGPDKPSLDNFKELLTNEFLYVLEDLNGDVVATAILKNYDKDYDKIIGRWKYKSNYLVIHRLGVKKNQRNKGYAKILIKKIESFAKEKNTYVLRIDTHEVNIIMQKLLQSLAFEYAGIVYLGGKNKRLAFEKFLKN